MQTTNKTKNIATESVVESVEIKTVPAVVPAPLELPLEDLEQVAGGTPKGTW